MNRTIVVRRDYLHYVKKYARCARAWRAPCQRVGDGWVHGEKSHETRSRMGWRGAACRRWRGARFHKFF